jgi:hypothetical protein
MQILNFFTIKNISRLIRILSFFLIFYSCSTQKAMQKPVKEAPVSYALIDPFLEESDVILENAGNIKIVHGTAAGQFRHQDDEGVAELQGRMDVPAYTDEAVVILSGWRFRYDSEQRNIRFVRVSIEDVALNGNTLTWVARGQFGDENYDDNYEFQYYYTVITWNRQYINAYSAVLPKNGQTLGDLRNYRKESAVTYVASYAQDDNLKDKTSAILPRGFKFLWTNEYRSGGFTWKPPFYETSCFDCPADHELLQIAYNMDHSEASFASDANYQLLPSPSGSDRVASDIVSWLSYGIFKDNAVAHDYFFEEWTSLIWGKDVGIIDPPFAILPEEDSQSCLHLGPTGIITEEKEIDNIPFNFPVPILAGWDLSFNCEDSPIRNMGIWISDIEYDTSPNAALLTLRFKISSIFTNDSREGHYSRSKIKILGLNSMFVINPPPNPPIGH